MPIANPSEHCLSKSFACSLSCTEPKRYARDQIASTLDADSGTENVRQRPGRILAASSIWPAPTRIPSLPPELTREAATGSTSENFSTARIVTSSACSLKRSALSCTMTTSFRARARTTSRRNVAFFPWDSIRVNRRRGSYSFSTIPGNPAPEPTSIALTPEVRSRAFSVVLRTEFTVGTNVLH